jgi:hypothetical protein
MKPHSPSDCHPEALPSDQLDYPKEPVVGNPYPSVFPFHFPKNPGAQILLLL